MYFENTYLLTKSLDSRLCAFKTFNNYCQTVLQKSYADLQPLHQHETSDSAILTKALGNPLHFCQNVGKKNGILIKLHFPGY